MAPVGFLETGVLYCDDNLQRLSQLARTQLLGDVRDVEGVTAAADGAVLPVAVEAAASGPSGHWYATCSWWPHATISGPARMHCRAGGGV